MGATKGGGPGTPQGDAPDPGQDVTRADALAPDPVAVREFLELVFRSERIYLSAIGANGRKARWFDDLGESVTWACRMNRAENDLHYHQAGICDGLGKEQKPKAVDVHAARAVHGDLDVDLERIKSGHFEEDHAATIQRLRDAGADVIVDSGGGAQGLWWLDSASYAPADVQCVNRGVIEKLGGDKGTHDPVRLLRVAGTVNWARKPEKREAGRKPRMATLVESHEHVHTLEELAERFGSIPESKNGAQLATPPPTAAAAAAITEAELRAEFPAAAVRIALDMQKANGEQYANRSDGVFAFCCVSVRAEVPDNRIADALVCHAFPVSAHIYDQGGNPRQKAERQVARARRAVEREKAGPVAVTPTTDTPQPFLHEDWPDDGEETVPMLVPGFIPEGITFIGSAAKCGKTQILIHIGLQITTGGDVFGCYPIEETKRVLYVAREGQRWNYRRYSSMIERGEGIAHGDTGRRLAWATCDDCAMDCHLERQEGFDALRRFIDGHQADVVILETHTRFHSLDENAASTSAMLYERLQQLRSEFGVSVIVSHHARKASGDPALWKDPQLLFEYAFRGSGDFFAQADCALALAKTADKTACLEGRIAGSGRNGPLEPQDFSITYQGDESSRAAVIRMTGESMLLDAACNDWQQKLLGHLKQRPLNTRGVEAILGLGKTRKWEIVERLISRGLVAKDEKTQPPAKLYHLTDGPLPKPPTGPPDDASADEVGDE